MYPPAKVADLNVKREWVTTFPMSLFRSPDDIAGEATCRSKQHAPADPGPSRLSHKRD